MRTNDYRQIEKCNLKKVQWNTENVLMFIIKHFEMNKKSASNNPSGVDMPLNKKNQAKANYLEQF